MTDRMVNGRLGAVQASEMVTVTVRWRDRALLPLRQRHIVPAGDLRTSSLFLPVFIYISCLAFLCFMSKKFLDMVSVSVHMYFLIYEGFLPWRPFWAFPHIQSPRSSLK